MVVVITLHLCQKVKSHIETFSHFDPSPHKETSEIWQTIHFFQSLWSDDQDAMLFNFILGLVSCFFDPLYIAAIFDIHKMTGKMTTTQFWFCNV